MDFLQFQELYHHGIKGQHWGIRKYQNEDGSLTEEGKARYGYDETTGKISKEGKKVEKSDIKEASKEARQYIKDYRKQDHTLAKTLLFDDKNGSYSNMKRGVELGKISEKYGTKVAKSIERSDILKATGIAASLLAATGAVVLIGTKAAAKM